MSNQAVRKKLILNRETIRTLDAGELGEIHGGTTPATPGIFTVSVRVCQHSDKIIGGAFSVVKTAKWAYDHRPKGNPTDPPSVVGATA